MKKKQQPRNEFRDHKRSGHPKYIYEKVGDEYKFLGITHSSTSKGVRNIQLERDPDPTSENDRSVYIQTSAEMDKTKQFKPIKKGWKFGDKDKNTVKKIIKANKKRSAPSKSK